MLLASETLPPSPSSPSQASIHGDNWTEWEVVVNGRPRYPGHFQPNIPLEDGPGFGRAARENTPAGMAAKVQTARAHGVTAFMFDWYWYAKGLFIVALWL